MFVVVVVVVNDSVVYVDVIVDFVNVVVFVVEVDG